MGSTNFTPNYELSQFIGTDKPAWLQDYNGDMLKIDTGIAGAKTAADNAQSAADGAQGDATSALNSIANINTELGTVENTLSTATGNINTINSLIGNGTPTTTDQTLIGAINEINNKTVKFVTVAEDTGDGVKTYANVLATIKTAFSTLSTEDRESVVLISGENKFYCIDASTGIFSLTSILTQELITDVINLTNETYERLVGATYSDLSSSVYPNGNKIRLVKPTWS